MSKKFEHTYLRNEIEINKKMFFERALLIAAAALAATLVPKDVKGIELLGIPSIGALAFNLWFTVNRLESNMRIIAYIQLFHESKTEFAWIGWENALRAYRIWLNKCSQEVEAAKLNYAKISQKDNLNFYRPFLILYVIMAVLIVILMSFKACVAGPYQTAFCKLPVSFFIIINIVALILFILWVFVFYRPNKIEHGIEKNRIIWLAVIESYTNGCLKQIIGGELFNKNIQEDTNAT